jgi:hypothetical protein
MADEVKIPNAKQYPAGQDQRPQKDRAEEAQRAGYVPPVDPASKEAQAGDEGVKPPKDMGVLAKRTHFPVLLKKGYWPKNGGEKLQKGTVVDVEVGEAKEMITAGIADRADPIPEALT